MLFYRVNINFTFAFIFSIYSSSHTCFDAYCTILRTITQETFTATTPRDTIRSFRSLLTYVNVSYTRVFNTSNNFLRHNKKQNIVPVIVMVCYAYQFNIAISRQFCAAGKNSPLEWYSMRRNMWETFDALYTHTHTHTHERLLISP